MALSVRFLFRPTPHVSLSSSLCISPVSVGESFLRSASARGFARKSGGASPDYESDVILMENTLGLGWRIIPQSKLQLQVVSSKFELLNKEVSKDFMNKCKKVFEEVFKKEQPIIDPEDPAAVAHFAKIMKTIKEKTNSLSATEWCRYRIERRTRNIPDARTYFRVLKEEYDDEEIYAAIVEALNKVEKELKKPLMLNDVTGVAMMTIEYDKIREKYGLFVPKHVEEWDLQMAKAQLEQLKKSADEAWETQKKQAELKGEEMPKTIEMRAFIVAERLW